VLKDSEFSDHGAWSNCGQSLVAVGAEVGRGNASERQRNKRMSQKCIQNSAFDWSAPLGDYDRISIAHHKFAQGEGVQNARVGW